MQVLFNDGFIKVVEDRGTITVSNVSFGKDANPNKRPIASVHIHPNLENVKIYLDNGKFELVSGKKNTYIQIKP